MSSRCVHDFLPGDCYLCAALPGGLPRYVFITSGGRVYHLLADCRALLDGQREVLARDGQISPIEHISTKDALSLGRPPCSECAS